MKHELKPGKMTEVEVSNLGIVLLTLPARRGSLHEMPRVRVYEEYTGFTSIIRHVTLTSSKETSKGQLVDSYEIAVEWSPGGDQSGSFIEVTHPNIGAAARAKIFMAGP
jgi:hypothetical protein